jgi:hypothetical protein
MRYFFDVHLQGQTFLDERGAEFDSLEQARQHVIATARRCMAEGTSEERKLLVQLIVEVTDKDALSEVILLADAIPHRRPRRLVLRDASTRSTELARSGRTEMMRRDAGGCSSAR